MMIFRRLAPHYISFRNDYPLLRLFGLKKYFLFVIILTTPIHLFKKEL